MSSVVASVGLKAAAPALFASYRALSREWARRHSDKPSGLNAKLHAALAEAIAVLSQQSEDIASHVQVRLKGLISRPELFRHAVPAAWMATELTQEALRGAALALIRGETDAPFATRAIEHYLSFYNDDEDDNPPSGAESYAEALDFILRSLRRDLELRDEVLLEAIGGVREEVRALAAPDNSAILDGYIVNQLLRLRQRRFFRAAQTRETAIELATSLLDGPLRGGSAAVRADTLAWCARLIVYSDPDLASAYCTQARTLAGRAVETVTVAKAFLTGSTDWKAGLALVDPDVSPLQATVAFQIMRRGLEAGGAALDYAARAGLSFAQLDGDGRLAWINAAIEAGRWSDAVQRIGQLGEGDFEQTPALLWAGASALVAARLPDDLKGSVLQDIPPGAAHFPLPDDSAALEGRRLAARLMREASVRCADLDLPVEALVAGRYALWLALRDPEQREEALLTLRTRMDDPKTSLAYLPLALGFGLNVNLDDAQQLLERTLTRDAGSLQVAPAAFALLIAQAERGDPAAAAALLDRYRDALADYLAADSILSVEIRLLVDAGRVEDARALFAARKSDIQSDGLRTLLESGLGSDDGEASIEALETSYKQDPQTYTLARLVRAHGRTGFSERYLELARDLLRAVPTAGEATEIVALLIANERIADAEALLNELGGIVEASDDLLAFAASLHLRAGRLALAEQALTTLEGRRDAEQDRALRYQLLLTSGRWHELGAFIERQWKNRAALSPMELASAAAVAAQIDSGYAPDLIREAVERDPDDPHVLVSAYNAATLAGLEEAFDDASSWIMRAAERSGEDGPVQTASFKDLIDQQSDWNERVEQASLALAGGEVPIILAAAALRRSWLELLLVPIQLNPDIDDPRRRTLVPLLSGQPWTGERALQDQGRIALDATAVVTLATFGLLKPVLEAFDEVVVAHDLLSDLFAQQQRIDFHQPSRIQFARNLSTLVDKGRVRPFEPTVPLDRALAKEVGPGLAALLGEAAVQPSGQHIVIHPYPITRVGSLLSDPVPLDDHRDRLASCSAVVDVLKRKSRVTSAEEARARSYLSLHDRRWPDEPVIERGATLYLSDLAISYLRFVGLLDRIDSAGLTVVVSQSELDHAAALRERAAIAGKVAETLELVRGQISSGLADGKVVLDARPLAEHNEDQPQSILAMARLAEQAGVVVYDDRCLNRYPRFTHTRGDAEIWSSLELVEALARDGRIDPGAITDLRTRLRLAGVAFLPLSAEELIPLLAASDVKDNRLVESAELRAVREQLRLGQLKGWLAPLAEARYLITLQEALVTALIAQWNADIDDVAARARSTWLMQLLDTRDWSESVVRAELGGLARQGLLLDLARLVTAAISLKRDPAKRFSAWLEETVFEPLWAAEPALKPRFLTYIKGMIDSLDNTPDPDHAQFAPHTPMQAVFAGLPAFLHGPLLEDDTFSRKLCLEPQPLATIGDGPSFVRTAFLDAIAAAYTAPGSTFDIADEKGRRWTVTSNDDWTPIFRRGRKTLTIRPVFAVHPNPAERVAGLEARADAQNIALSAIADWRERLALAPFSADEIDRLEKDLAAFPGAIAYAIGASVEQGTASIDLLVPDQQFYYERLTGPLTGETLQDYILKALPAFVDTLRTDDPVERAKDALLLAAHSELFIGAGIGDLSDAQWQTLAQWAETAGDPFSMIGLAEMGLSRAAERPALEPLLLSLIGRIEALDPDDEEGLLSLFASTAMLTDGELSRQPSLADQRPFRRRLAAFAQAALITRAVAGRIQVARFRSFVLEQRSWQYFVQNLCDLRSEPRWRPDYLAPKQLHNELLGRLVNSAAAAGAERLGARLNEALLTGSNALRSRVPYPMAFWPGPLEGSDKPDRPSVPDEMRDLLEASLAETPLPLEALTLIVNLDTMFEIPAELLGRGVERIEALGPQLFDKLEPDVVESYLSALAYVAASQRSGVLAALVWRFASDWRKDAGLDVAVMMQIALCCAAAWPAETDWRTQLGDRVRELAWSVETDNEGTVLEAWIEAICRIDPEARTTLSRSLAAVRALGER